MNIKSIIYSLRSKDKFVQLSAKLLKDKPDELEQLMRSLNSVKRLGRDQKERQLFTQIIP